MKKDKINLNNILYNFGLDHLEIFGTFKYKSIFNKLKFNDFSYLKFYGYKFKKVKVSKYHYKIIFYYNEYSLFVYYEGIPKSKKQPIGTKSYIVVYSTAFKILEYEEIVYFLEFYLNLKHTRRFDIALDLKININDLLENYFIKPKTGREYKKSGSIETLYFGEIRNSKNKRQLIRVYNKLLDINEKKKTFLYQDYLTNKDITRVELEVRQELAKNKNYKELFNNILLIGIFKNYLYKYTKIFEEISGEKITLYKSKNLKLNAEDYQNLVDKVINTKQFIGYAKSIFNQGFCPVQLLLKKRLFNANTKDILGLAIIDYFSNLGNYEKK